MKIDMKKLAQDTNDLSKKLKALKTEMRQPGAKPTWKQYHELRALKEEATARCALKAWCRKRLHCKQLKDLDAAAKFVEAMAKRYDLEAQKEEAVIPIKPEIKPEPSLGQRILRALKV